jgi:hypothetical protein
VKRFSEWFWSSSAPMRYVLVCLALAGGYFVLQKLHHRDGVADFRVYYDAANAWLHGESPYGKAFGVSSGFYKYSPVALVPFSLLAWMPYPLASGIYYFLVLAAFIAFSLVLVRFFEMQFGFPAYRRGLALALITLFLIDHFERELHLGNVNVFLLIAAFGLHEFIRKEKMHWAGLLYAAMLLVKPHFAILLPFFIWKKQWKVLLWTVAGGAAGLLLPAVASGWQGNINLHTAWLDTMQEHNVRLSDSPNTIYGIVNEWVLSWFGAHADTGLILFGLLVTGAGFLFILLRNRAAGQPMQSYFFELFLLIALIPNLAHTDTEHFMWSWPLIAYVILSLIHFPSLRKPLMIALVVLAFIPYAVNSPDIVGRKVMLLFDEGGLLGLSNLLILAIATGMFLTRNRLGKATSAAVTAS